MYKPCLGSIYEGPPNITMKGNSGIKKGKRGLNGNRRVKKKRKWGKTEKFELL